MKWIVFFILILLIGLVGCTRADLERECRPDCASLGLEFWKVKPAGFGLSSCWCKGDANIVNQVW